MPEIHDIIESLIAAIHDFKQQGGTLTKPELQKLVQRQLPDWKGTIEQRRKLKEEFQRCLGTSAPRRDQAVPVSQTIEAAQTLKQLLKSFTKKELINLIEVL